MNNALAIYQKELNSYFRSPIAYGVMTFFSLIAGYFFYVAVVYFVQFSIQASMSGQSQPMSVNDSVVRPLLGNFGVVALFVIPMIAMRLFAEEKRTGTIELLATSPVKDWEIIAGKFLAAVTLYAAILGLTLISMAMLFIYGKPDLRPLLVGYLGLLLQGATLLAVCTFISTTTKNQIIAGVGGFGACLLLWVIGWMSQFQDSAIGKVVSYFSIVEHFDSFSKGVLDSKDIIYYVSAIFIGLFLTARSLEAFRWRA